MSKETRSPFKIRNVKDSTGWYSSDYLSLARDAIESLAELEAVTEEVKQNWPLPLGETIREPRLYPEIKVLAARRDRLSMATLIFSAMAVEAFLNYYGVLRIGEAAYTKHFERRLSMVEKLSALLQWSTRRQRKWTAMCQVNCATGCLFPMRLVRQSKA